MSFRPRSSLARVLDDLGSTLLQSVLSGPAPARDIDGMYIFDAFDELECPEGCLVLGVGVHPPEQVAQLLLELGRRRAAALVVRAPVEVDSAVRAAAGESDVVLLGLAPGATWAQLAALLRTVLGDADAAADESQTLGGIPSGDMFALANAVAALVDAPVTIEDRSSRVLAFSGRQDEADPARVATILGRQVPRQNQLQMEGRGDFSRLYRQGGPVYIEPLVLEPVEFSLPRVAVAVRAGDEILGSIWVAVQARLGPDRMAALADAAKLVALHMLQRRAGADVERRLRTDLVGTALEGGSGADEAASRLGLRGRPCIVMAMSLLEAGDDDGPQGPGQQARSEADRQRLVDALAMHLSAMQPRAATALLGQAVYGILPIVRSSATAEEQAIRAGSAFLQRSNVSAVIGIGTTAGDAAALARSRADADRALRVLQARAEPGQVATMRDVHLDALLLELDELSRSRGHVEVESVDRLAAYDAEHQSNLVETLGCWMDTFGDVPAAAARSFVHPNTFRYRLRRLARVGEIDLDDADERFAAMLQLRMRMLRRPSVTESSTRTPDRRAGGAGHGTDE